MLALRWLQNIFISLHYGEKLERYHTTCNCLKKILIDSNISGVKLIFWFEDLVTEMGS